MDGRVKLLADASMTSGQFALLEIAGVQGEGPPRHRHESEDETIYVLDGQVAVALEEQFRQLSAGECVVLPRGRIHAYRVISDEARFLVVVAPAGLEASYLDGVWHADDLERLVAVAARSGIEVTGPPVEEAHGDPAG